MKERKECKPIAILGAGSWGTALALYLARRGQIVKLWSVETAEIEAMLADKANNQYLPGLTLPDTIYPTANLKEALSDNEDILIAVPSIGFKQTLLKIKSVSSKPLPRLICATKGLDTETGRLLSQVALEVFNGKHLFAVLSGPSFAREVAAGLPAALMIASQDEAFLTDLQSRFNSSLMRVYPTQDVIGVEIGGVVKNVIAIATGILDGMQLGANARSALITHGLAEIIRLGNVLGAQTETMIGLSGLGDLILTCSDNQSRNRRLGLAIGKGQSIQEAETAIGQVVEGKRNAELVAMLAKKHQVTMPICETVLTILNAKSSAKEAFAELFNN